jgi:glycosyltransferase involved in cell wall biosynthesis
VKPERIRVIKGSGVDIDQFAPTPEPAEPVVATVVSRMLKDKGIREVVLAARELKRRGSKVEIRFVGAPDAGNPTSISEQTLDQWNKEGCIRWLGHQENVAAMWSMAHIAVLPSYREGMPMSLLEAAACGRPIVTTDVQGCNEFVEDGVNGFLIPVNDWIRLADSIETLAASPELRTRFGAAARMKVEAGYDEQTVVDQTVAFYMKTLDDLGPDVAVSTPDSLRP